MICGALQTLNEEAAEDVLEEVQDPAASLHVPEAGENGPRPRTLSQSSYTEANETNVLIFQQGSPLHPPYWTPAPTPGGSAASSVANTPVLQRKRRDSKSLARSQPNSRPVSLLVAVPGEEDSLLPEELHPQIVKQSSNSTLSKVATTLLGTRRATAPALTITPAGSVEASDDESTPLMSEMSSPTHTPGHASLNQGFGSPPSSDLSPASVKSTPTHDGPQDYATYPLYSVTQEVQFSSRLSRQNATESEEDFTSTWGDPETTV